jgi:hypothetical protein
MNTQVINPTVKFGNGYVASVHPLAVLELNDGTYIQALQKPTVEDGEVILIGRSFPDGSQKASDVHKIADLNVKRVIPAFEANSLEEEINAKLATA